MKRDEALKRFAETIEERLGLSAHLKTLDLSYQKEMKLRVKSFQVTRQK
ncbi:MAG TPA: hypothetical protein VEH56_04440 [Candidatus Saccharimonadales bacterium]|nr:hypothetical protein [Candidatus Saccharimonadales bacterium]